VCGLAGLSLLAYDQHIAASPNRNTFGPISSRCEELDLAHTFFMIASSSAG
jgi:hypothetical protein